MGAARKNKLAQERADARSAEAQAEVDRDQIENEVWTALLEFEHSPPAAPGCHRATGGRKPVI